MRMTDQDPMFNEDQMLMQGAEQEMQPQAGSIEAIDPLDRMPPGHSLTQPKGKWAWDQPSRFTDPEEAIDFIIDKLEEPAVEKDMLKLMLAGISIEEMVETIALGGFSTGHYTPDVAELIKPPISAFLVSLAFEANIPAIMFNNSQDSQQTISDDEVMYSMRESNPEAFEHIQRQAVMEDLPPVEPDNFLEMGDVDNG